MSFAKIYSALCVVSTLLGVIIGWQVGEQIGIAALPPNAWAGDGIGILVWNIHGASWGALTGFGVGVICCFAWRFYSRWRQSRKAISHAAASEDQIWPSAPTHRP